VDKRINRIAGGGRNAGFTLMEMIIVMVIIGVVVAAVLPNVGAGLGGTRAQIAARGLVQMSRYARSMALANQTEVELVVSSNGLLRVRASQRSVNLANSGETGEGDAYGNAAMASAWATASTETTGGSARQASVESLEASIAQEKKFEHVNFVFDGYTDGLGRTLTEREGGGKTPEGGEAVVTFRSNGVCKPCRFAVVTQRGNTLYVSLGMTGKGKVEVEP